MPEPTKEPTITAIEKKLEKGETLTPEEKKEIMSDPNLTGESNIVTVTPKEEFEEESTETADAKKKADEEAEAAKAKETAEGKVSLDRVFVELEKPEGKEDLKNFSDMEKGLYHELKRTRKRAQKAEEELDVVRLEKLKLQKPAEEPPKEDDPFKDREPDDFVTVEDIRKSRAQTKPKEEAKAAPANPYKIAFQIMAERAARAKYADYDDVIECAEEIIADNKDYLQKIAEGTSKGENPAELIYEIIKKDEQFPNVLPIAKARRVARMGKPKETKPTPEQEAEAERKRKEAEEAERRIKENETKAKTSGHHSGGAEGTEGAELSLEQITTMSDEEFRALPKAKRQYYLKKYGV